MERETDFIDERIGSRWKCGKEFTIREIAETLSVSDSIVLHAVRQNQLRMHRAGCGSEKKATVEDIAAWLQDDEFVRRVFIDHPLPGRGDAEE